MNDWRSATQAERDIVLPEIMELAQDQASLLDHRVRVWASVTFHGARHAIDLAFVGDDALAAAELFIAILPEHEFNLPGWIVADAAVNKVARDDQRLTVSIELLLLDDRP